MAAPSAGWNAIPRRAFGPRSDQRARFPANGLKREELIATNSMLLHKPTRTLGEAGGGDSKQASSPRRSRATSDQSPKARPSSSPWGKALGGVRVGGADRSARDGTLVNVWAADNPQPGPAARVLALDMYEHSYHIDLRPNAGATSMPSWPTSPGKNRAASPASRPRQPHTVDTTTARNMLEADPTSW